MKTTRMRIMASLILGLFIVFSGVMASCSSTTVTYTTPTSGTTQYQSSEYGYSINVLPQWAVNSTDPSSVVIGSPNTLDYVHIVSSEINNIDLAQFVTDCEKVFQADYPKTFAEESSAQVTISGGVAATSLTIVFVKDEVPMQATVIATVNGGFGYCVYGAAPLAGWNTYKNDLTDTINSFKIMNLSN